MKLLLSMVLSAIVALNGLAQLPVWHGDFAFSDDSSQANDYIGLVSEYTINSNVLSNGFINDIPNDGFISDELKKRELDKANNNVRLGIVLDAALWYKHRLENSSVNLVFNIRGRSFLALDAKKDFMEAVLFGNEVEKKSEFSTSTLTQYIHQEMYVGGEKLFKNARLLVGGGLAIQKLAKHRAINLDGSIYTGPYATYIDFDMQFKNEETRSASANNLKRNEGFGVTINTYAEKQFANKSRLGIDVRDIGFIHIPEVDIHEIDTNGRWEGINIEDNLADLTIRSNYPSTTSIKESRKSKKLLTTGSINMSYKMAIGSKMDAYVGVNHFFTSAYKPRFYVRPYYKFREYLSVGIPLAYGGFGKLDFGLSLKGKVIKNYYYTVDINYLENLVMANKSSGQGFNVGLSAMF